MLIIYYRKIFPPTPEELPPAEKASTDAQEAVEESGVIVPKETTSEPAQKKAKTESQEGANKEEWEDVQKPDPGLDKSIEMSEEGEKVDQPDLAESEGEEVEKPKEEVIKSAGGFELVEEGEKAAK